MRISDWSSDVCSSDLVAAAGTDFQAVAAHIGPVLLVLIGVGAVLLFCLGGFYMVEPNQAAVLSLFGKYVGTVKDQGLRWSNTFYAAKKVSLRVRNLESGRLKIGRESCRERVVQ